MISSDSIFDDFPDFGGGKGSGREGIDLPQPFLDAEQAKNQEITSPFLDMDDDDLELQELEREISEMIESMTGRAGNPFETRSRRLELLLRDDSGCADERFRHYCGILMKDTKNFHSSREFFLRCGHTKVPIRVNAETVAQLSDCEKGRRVHVVAIRIHEQDVAKVICSHEFFKMFDVEKNLRKKAVLMERFLRLPEEQKRSIEHQQQGKHYPLDGGERRALFRTREELRLKYEICKDTYTPQQQREIELLFTQPESGRSKSTKKLEYILNISNTCWERKAVHRRDIIRELDRHLYKLDKVKEKIASCLVAGAHATERGMRILLVGRPGTGKTTIARTIAETYGIPFDVISLCSVISAIDLKGIDSTYDGADAGRLIKSFYSLGTTEAVIVLDEIDKMGTNTKDGNPSNALLDVLSDEHVCYDAFLEMGVDTTNTVFIATANSTMGIPDTLLNRFDVIAVDDYEDEDKIVIAEKYIVPETLRKYGIAEDEITFSRDALTCIVKRYCSDSGARMLKENIRILICHVINAWDEEQAREKTEIGAEYAASVLESFIEEDDPVLRFARNKGKYREDVRSEIRKIIDSLAVQSLTPEEKDRNYRRLQYLTALIPNEREIGRFDAERFYRCVDRSHYGMESVKRTIAGGLHARALQGRSFSSERLLLAGGAGIGKTSICESIAEALNVPFVRISLNGINDESAIKGFSPTYAHADAGEIVKGLSRVRTTRAVVQLDEIDKLGNHNGVRVSNALFDLLDNSASFTDRFLGVPIDLSDVLFIATANDLSDMEPWLMDRFSIIRLEGYTRSDKQRILEEFILPRIEREYAAVGLKVEVTPEAEETLVRDYCTSFGVRDLEKAMKTIVTDKLYDNPKATHLVVDPEDVARIMGAKPVPRGNLLKTNVPGFSKALAVTGANCGMAFSIETAILPDETCTCITGLPKESAIDSVKLAKTFIRLHYAAGAKDFGVHLHFGEGAVVKDGPSAGVAILVSMLSAVFDTPVKGNAAYTGEIDLFGNVFAIGGTIAKIQAAEDSGCEKVFIPYDNYSRLKEEDLRKFTVEIVPVHHVSEVIDEVLPALNRTETPSGPAR